MPADPNGIQQMSSTKPGCVESSSNLGVVHQDGEDMLFISEARSTYESTRELLVEKQKVLAGYWEESYHPQVTIRRGYTEGFGPS